MKGMRVDESFVNGVKGGPKVRLSYWYHNNGNLNAIIDTKCEMIEFQLTLRQVRDMLWEIEKHRNENSWE